MNKGTIWHEFDQLRHASGLDRETLGRRARVHDIRHSLCCARWLAGIATRSTSRRSYRCSQRSSGIPIRLTCRCYMEAAPELLAMAAQRLQRTWEQHP
jgi:hypothetical protein